MDSTSSLGTSIGHVCRPKKSKQTNKQKQKNHKNLVAYNHRYLFCFVFFFFFFGPYLWHMQISGPGITSKQRQSLSFTCCITVETPTDISFFFFFLRAALMAYGSSQDGVESKLQLLAYTTATAMPDPNHVCDSHHSSQKHWILFFFWLFVMLGWLLWHMEVPRLGV